MPTRRRKTHISLTGARIKTDQRSHPMIELAARELSKYLFRLSGVLSPISRSASPGTVVELHSEKDVIPCHFDRISDQRFHLRVEGEKVSIIGVTPLGTLYGVYALLERLGVGFYLGGDTFPAHAIIPTLPAGLDIIGEPCFAARGSNLHGNLLIGASGWGEYDWRFYIDQMSRMRCNIFMLHLYGNEPGGRHEFNGEISGIGRPHSSMTPAFGIHPKPTSDFYFGTHVYFDQDIFGSIALENARDLLGQNLSMERNLRMAIRYARMRGVSAVAGFEIPQGVDCTDARIRARFTEALRQFIRRYPELPYLGLWQGESLGLVGEPVPKSSSAQKLIRQKSHFFSYLGGDHRVYAAIHLAEFAQLAYHVLKEEGTGTRLVICGWGGDRWHRFADQCLGLDQVLPKDVVFTCHDNIDPRMVSGVSAMWGHIPPDRQRWAQVWIESDGDEMWTRQPNVESLSRLLPDALSKKCQGSLALHWRTGDFEEELGYLARFAWDSNLSPARYYHDYARRTFGSIHTNKVARILGDLQQMGPRWTGIFGGLECASFVWTGRTPHWPFEVDSYGVELAKKIAQETVKRLRLYGFPQEARECSLIVNQLDEIARSRISRACLPKFNRLKTSIEQIYEDLLTRNAPVQVWEMVIKLMEILHFLLTRADLHRRTNKLIRLRNQLANSAGVNSERVDWLLSTIAVTLALDRAGVALAEPGPVVELLVDARRHQSHNSRSKAIQAASAAYQKIIGTNIQEMLAAQTRKLNTQCEWGVLALMNLKVLPRYWETLAQAEAILPAVPPHEVFSMVTDCAVRLHWKCLHPATGYHVYRRRTGAKTFHRLTRAPIAATFDHLSPYSGFVDYPSCPGCYEYAVMAVDAKGWESPLSHCCKVNFGFKPVAPQLLGVHQDFCFIPEQPHEVRVIILAPHDDEISSAVLRFRELGETKWQEHAMLRRFRNGWHAFVPPYPSRVIAIEYYVEAVTTKGQKAVWPKNAGRGRYWTATVIPEGFKE